jgi:hypothetical protein
MAIEFKKRKLSVVLSLELYEELKKTAKVGLRKRHSA